MPNFGTIVGLISAGRALSGLHLYRRLLSGVVVLVALVAASAMLASGLLIGLFYAAYLGFVAYGLTEIMAVFATLGLGLLLLAILVAVTLSYARQVLELPKLIVEHQFPVASRVSGVFQSFMDGALGKSQH